MSFRQELNNLVDQYRHGMEERVSQEEKRRKDEMIELAGKIIATFEDKCRKAAMMGEKKVEIMKLEYGRDYTNRINFSPIIIPNSVAHLVMSHIKDNELKAAVYYVHESSLIFALYASWE